MKNCLRILLCLVLFESCHKPCTLPNYLFLANTIFSPEKDSIKVNDTLWLSCIINKNLNDINTQKTVDFSSAENMGTDLLISDILKFSSERGAVDSFDYIKRHGNIYTDPSLNPKGAKQLSFEENSTSYLLDVGLIARKAGSYILTVPDNSYVYRKGMPKCGTGNFLFINTNSKKHLYLFENIRGQLSEYDSAHSYCFKVY